MRKTDITRVRRERCKQLSWHRDMRAKQTSQRLGGKGIHYRGKVWTPVMALGYRGGGVVKSSRED